MGVRRGVVMVPLLLACSGGPLATPGDLDPPRDAGLDARDDPGRADVGAPRRVPLGGACTADGECADATFCNGEERCAAGRCVAGADPCDDGARCTADVCDEAMRRCARTADAARCADGDRCNGDERCDPAAPGADRATGCVRPVVGPDCNDNDPCTVDACTPAQGCVHAPRDLDGDGHVDRGCPRDGRRGGAPGDDCDDGDPTVHPQVAERCDDGRDNNCDGLVDLSDVVACRPMNGACVSAAALRAVPGGFIGWGASGGFAPGAPLPCAAGAVARPTAWFRFALTEPRDVVVRVDDGAREGEAPGAVALLNACGAGLSTRCAAGSVARDGGAGADPSLAAAGLGAGVWYVAVQTAGARPFALRVDVAPRGDGGT